MKRRSFLTAIGATGLLTVTRRSVFTSLISNLRESALEESFLSPPESARAYAWWQWMNGNITKEGITLDLEAMKRVGLAGFQLFEEGTGTPGLDLGCAIPKGPVVYGSQEYWELKKHAIREAARLGLSFEMHNCAGWFFQWWSMDHARTLDARAYVE